MTSVKRLRRKRPMRMKDGQLSVSWGYTREMGEDIYYTNGPGTSSCDARLLDHFFGFIKPVRVLDGETEPTLLDQLKERGYDLKTLRFTIQKIKVNSSESRKEQT